MQVLTFTQARADLKQTMCGFHAIRTLSPR